MAADTQRLFGTDGVRGRANSELTPELAFDLARAAGEGVDGHVVIGRDTRRSSPMLSAAASAGFNAVGVDVVDLGIIPVGAVSRLGRDTGASLSVMVSASHNPAEDNGIKFFGRDGAKLTDADEASIEDRYRSGRPYSRPVAGNVGIQTTMHDAIDRYVERVANTVSYSMRGLERIRSIHVPRQFNQLDWTVGNRNAVAQSGPATRSGSGAHAQQLYG